MARLNKAAQYKQRGGNMLQFGRDPFARHTRTRQTVTHDGQVDCGWCGRKGRQTRTGRFLLYRYGVEPDAGRPYVDAGQFCSVSCRDAYYS